ncbi:3D domain-containing protein [Hoeflea ulvae]|uniref:3D domain-containing protein n=1 Tax=Hoeflea ulvae TaxID=2983764 RepID=A0ABT3YFB3_9HYPH|nr:3D domain-containing protein [Hoeflea ulvae]MCY0094533.1 3D domain-containing protein [Hoeflea ulvae]
MYKYRSAILIAIILFITNPYASHSQDFDISNSTKVKLWATFYYALKLEEYTQDDAVPIRNMQDQVIGPKIQASDWCKGAIEGTIHVASQVFNYAGVRNPKQADCPHKSSSRVRWTLAKHPYGDGSRGNPLLPFKTLACDLGTVENSEPWLNGGYAKFGQRIYIPAAKGIALPNGQTHDGIFECGDVGGKITGNHIDVFLGAVSGGYSNAAQLNPFNFVKSDPGKTFDGYVLN